MRLREIVTIVGGGAGMFGAGHKFRGGAEQSKCPLSHSAPPLMRFLVSLENLAVVVVGVESEPRYHKYQSVNSKSSLVSMQLNLTPPPPPTHLDSLQNDVVN